MSVTLDDMADAAMNAHAKFAEWQADYTERMLQPIVEDELMSVWNTMTPEQHAALKASDPANYQVVEKLVGKLGVRNGNAKVRGKQIKYR